MLISALPKGMKSKKALWRFLAGAVVFALAGSLSCAASAAEESRQGLYAGKSAIDVIYFDAADRQSQAGAEELAGYLERVLGRKYTLTAAAAGKTALGAGIYVGPSLAPEALKKGLPAEAEEWFCRVTAGDKIWLWGNDNPGKKFNGTRWAVQDFLERECGVRWLWPGKLGEVVPQKKLIALTDSRLVERPVFKIREIKGGYPFYSAAEARDLQEWTMRMRQGRSMSGYKGSSGFGHATGSYIPKSLYAADHPEYYSLVTPKNWVTAPKPARPARTTGVEHWQACTSNPDVRRIYAEKIIANNSPDIQSITPNDGYAFCECDKCKAQDPVPWDTYASRPNMSDRIFDFAGDIARQVKAGSPEAKVGILAYGFYSEPPVNIKQVPDNLYVCLTYLAGEFRDPERKRKFEEQVRGFRAMGVRFNAYEYWGTHYYFNIPWLHTRLIDENLKFFSRNGGDGIRGEGGKDYANNALNYYLISKLLWNPEVSREAIIDDFCRSAFGNGAESMKAYFDSLESAVDGWFARELAAGRAPTGGYAVRMNGYVDMYNPQVLAAAEKLLIEAGRKALQPEEKARVDFFRTGLNYTQIVVEMIANYQAAAAHGATLMFVWPQAGITSISDEQIGKALLAADQSNRKREALLTRMAGTNALDLGFILYLNRTDKHPWDKIIQDSLWAWRKGEHNYLVNGAFEYHNSFGWEVSSFGSGNAYAFDSESNHDDIANLVAQYHANQGKSLKLTMAPKSSFKAASTVAVKSAPGTRWSLSGWLQQGTGTAKVEAVISWKIDGKKKITPLRRQARDEDVKDSQGWYEIQFMPFTVPDGKDIEFSVLLKTANTGRSTAVVRMDDLKLKKLR